MREWSPLRGESGEWSQNRAAVLRAMVEIRRRRISEFLRDKREERRGRGDKNGERRDESGGREHIYIREREASGIDRREWGLRGRLLHILRIVRQDIADIAFGYIPAEKVAGRTDTDGADIVRVLGVWAGRIVVRVEVFGEVFFRVAAREDYIAVGRGDSAFFEFGEDFAGTDIIRVVVLGRDDPRRVRPYASR